MPKNKDPIDEFVDNDIKDTKGDDKEPDKEEKPAAPPIDVEALKEEVKTASKEEAVKEVTEKITNALNPKEDNRPSWEKEGRNPTYKEALDYVRDSIKKEQDQKEQEKENKSKAEEEEKTKRQEEYKRSLNEMWDIQIEELRESGKIPKIENKDDKNDPGIIAEKELAEAAIEYNKERDEKHQDWNLKSVYYEVYQNKNKQPAGYDAPVSMGKKSVENGKKELTYDEIHKSSFDDILMSH